ncbi:MAG: hypothetical protein U9N36_02920 [Euryarchaeota archaeon]|nr:hypothetical protein [Euryarchaeota archaeon]
MTNLLEKELRTYETKKAEFIGKYGGKFALIKNRDFFDVFDTKLDAV